MNPPVDLQTLTPNAQRIVAPETPQQMKLMAAKGVALGLKPSEIVVVVALLAESDDPTVAQTATETFRLLPQQVLDSALEVALPCGVVDLLARAYLRIPEVVAKLLAMPDLALHTVEMLAENGTEAISELIAVNESMLLENPSIIDRLYMNRCTRMSTADRVLELAVRHGIELHIPAFHEAAIAIKDELIAEPTAEPTPDDILFTQVDLLSASLFGDDSQVVEEEFNEKTEEVVEKVADKFRPLWAQFANMSISQKIRRAMLGTGVERLLLVRDTNRLVATAAVRSPAMREPEIEQVSRSRQVDEEVLRIIAKSPSWTRSHAIKLNLVQNPRTPFTFVAGLIGHLRDGELRALVKNKNVSSAVTQMARHHLLRRQK